MGLPEGFLPVHGIETDFVDTDVDTDPEFVENEEIKKAVIIKGINIKFN